MFDALELFDKAIQKLESEIPNYNIDWQKEALLELEEPKKPDPSEVQFTDILRVLSGFEVFLRNVSIADPDLEEVQRLIDVILVVFKHVISQLNIIPNSTGPATEPRAIQHCRGMADLFCRLRPDVFEFILSNFCESNSKAMATLLFMILNDPESERKFSDPLRPQFMPLCYHPAFILSRVCALYNKIIPVNYAEVRISYYA